MPLARDDRALAAFLLERDLVPLEELMSALSDAVALPRSLGACLVSQGTLDEAELVSLREEVARYARVGARPVLARSVEESHEVPLDAHGILPPTAASDEDTVQSLDEAMSLGSAGLAGRSGGDGAPSAWPVGSNGVGGLPSPMSGPGARVQGTPASSDPRSRTPLVDDLRSTQKSPDWGGSDVPAESSSPPPGVRGVDLAVVRELGRLTPSGHRAEERYQLLGEIGRGGMGRILRARDTEIGREVAIKVLLGGAQASENLVRRFWMEVQATGQLEHPSIIPIHDVGRLPSGELFYVMKMLSGRTLAEILSALREGDTRVEAEFTRVRLLTVFQQIAYAVAFAHARGVVHRDIKPANIMIGRFGEAMLLDWGLAKLVEGPESTSSDLPRVASLGRHPAGATMVGTITGTPQYMSPEATSGRPELITSKSDIYGLGAVLYEILTLHAPFPDLGFVPTVVRVRKGEFKSPREAAPHRGITLELEELVLQAMSRDPGQRPGAKNLADGMGRILEGARERERRLLESRARLREGRKATERWKTLRVELNMAESEARRLAKEVPLWESIERKRAIWALEDRVSELKIEAIGAFEESEAAFLRALGEVPDDKEARAALAGLYLERFGEAEHARDVEAQRYYQTLVARYDDGLWSRILVGDGALEITASPEEVEVTIARMANLDRVLRPGEPMRLGRPPIRRLEMPVGSYLLTFKRGNDPEILRPVLLGRKESLGVHVRVRAVQEIGQGFVLIPGGPAILGGDPLAPGSFDRRVADIGDVAFARYPVTCEEYLAFLNARVEVDGEGARELVPRAHSRPSLCWRFNRDAGRFELPEGSASLGRLPVTGVSLRQAEAFIAWCSECTGQRLRLPYEIEWEKVARGVDARFFPWGDHFDPTFCNMKDSRPYVCSEPEPVGSFVIDQSPYGVSDLAGGVRELCMSDDGRPIMRGGAWMDSALFCRAAARHPTHPDFVNPLLGFRVAKDLD